MHILKVNLHWKGLYNSDILRSERKKDNGI